MMEPTQRDWRELCVAVVNENDPKKFGLLIQELTQVLDDSEKCEVGTLETQAMNAAPSLRIDF